MLQIDLVFCQLYLTNVHIFSNSMKKKILLSKMPELDLVRKNYLKLNFKTPCYIPILTWKYNVRISLWVRQKYKIKMRLWHFTHVEEPLWHKALAWGMWQKHRLSLQMPIWSAALGNHYFSTTWISSMKIGCHCTDISKNFIWQTTKFTSFTYIHFCKQHLLTISP